MRGTAVLPISHGCYLIKDYGGDVPTPTDTDTEHLIFPGVADSGGAVIGTGTYWGPVEIIVETFDDAPRLDESGTWEKSDEAVLESDEAEEIMVCNLDGDEGDLPRLSVTPGQAYHVRISARGFSDGQEAGELTAEDARPVETHLVQLWASET